MNIQYISREKRDNILENTIQIILKKKLTKSCPNTIFFVPFEF